MNSTRRAKQRALTIAVTQSGEESHLEELSELLYTSGVATVGELTQARSEPDPNTYLGKGKLAELKRLLSKADANLVACDDELSPRQERNLEQYLGVPVLDRTEIILDIFADHAKSAEGKLQVELAQLQYNMARMRGLWTHLERLGGGIGTRGPGETQIETDRRLARNRIQALKKKLATASSQRELMRTRRQQAAIPTVALAGYTNAGKSTLMNAITGAGVSVADRLFHTLDPTTRVYRYKDRPYLLTDTVGFIRKLPHQLVESFAATLEETRVADVVLHVVDSSLPDDEIAQSIITVDLVLREIGVKAPTILALNKIDILEGVHLAQLTNSYRDAVAVSAADGQGTEVLKERIEKTLRAQWQPVELLLPYERGDLVSELYDLVGDVKREDTPTGVLIKARVPATLAARYGEFAVNGS